MHYYPLGNYMVMGLHSIKLDYSIFDERDSFFIVLTRFFIIIEFPLTIFQVPLSYYLLISIHKRNQSMLIGKDKNHILVMSS